MKSELSRQTFEKDLNVKYHENPSSGSRVVQSGRTSGHTNMTKLMVAFRNFQTAPRNVHHVKLLHATIAVQTIVFH